ncbi:hypothetical protein FHX82_000768 [Amycolatopsis bartoniae]|uniref:Uncharacterized protein n=1 Tax=Amycolatopsis bartoniae TaxID=941986 RepID=A0A8H9MCG1_9PSEU|nr:hypothetical protein [Amycolatopsis bartoniae]MBB2933748.1 hypothetical protein [Amycolatopsis bartoniae]TVT10586.1 hypothetical protein FNH07_04985 [Amycolatopsis bartoniae]GHF71953.1 hypothetical protein GCM10017566_52140 [Amycolatopsis bartoniae]
MTNWLSQTGYPLEMRVAQRLQDAKLAQNWEREPNLTYVDVLTNEERETDYYLDWWEENDKYCLVFRIVIECKSTKNPWIVFRRAAKREQPATSLFDFRQNLTLHWVQEYGQLTPVMTALNDHLEGRVHQWPAPGYAIVEAFKGANSKDAAYNAARQTLSAAVGATVNTWDSSFQKLGCSIVAPIVITTSPLFEARLDNGGTSVVAQPVSCTSVEVELKSVRCVARVLIMNDERLDEVVADCLALEKHLPHFSEIFNPQLIKRSKGAFGPRWY